MLVQEILDSDSLSVFELSSFWASFNARLAVSCGISDHMFPRGESESESGSKVIQLPPRILLYDTMLEGTHGCSSSRHQPSSHAEFCSKLVRPHQRKGNSPYLPQNNKTFQVTC